LSVTLEPTTRVANEDECFTILGLDWSSYVAISDALGDQPKLRTLYIDGSLTFLSPAYIHESWEDYFDKIILAIAVGCEIEIIPIGSTTLRKAKGEVGLEGDKAYYLGEKAIFLAGMKELDLANDPPPDLAIEVENSNMADKSMAIYARLGVAEVWRHDVRRGKLGFWRLGADGQYAAIDRSLGFPFLGPEDVLSQVKRAEEIKSFTRWFVQLGDWVRDVIRPRFNGV